MKGDAKSLLLKNGHEIVCLLLAKTINADPTHIQKEGTSAFSLVRDHFHKVRGRYTGSAHRYSELRNRTQDEINSQAREMSALGLISCRTGCDHCCKSEEISATVREINIISKAIERLPVSTKEIVRRQISESRRTEAAESGKPMSPCALLVDGACSIYQDRPFVCRGHFSRLESDCVSRKRRTSLSVDSPIKPKALEYSFRVITGEMMEHMYEVNDTLRYLAASETMVFNGASAPSFLITNDEDVAKSSKNIPVSLVSDQPSIGERQQNAKPISWFQKQVNKLLSWAKFIESDTR